MGDRAARDECGVRLARRYHWHSAAVRDFTSDPHTAIVGESRGDIRNLVDARAKPAQRALLAIAREDPDEDSVGGAVSRDAERITMSAGRT